MIKWIKEELLVLVIFFVEVGEMGVLVIIEGGFGVGKMILLCVDIDVLELLDVIGIVYVFKNLGFNYVCGYDGYVVVLLGVVKVFKKY